MIRNKAILFLLVMVFLVACSSGNDTPPTELIIVTPVPTQAETNDQTQNYPATIVALETTIENLEQENATLVAQQDVTASLTPTESLAPTPTVTLMPTETLRPSNFPTASAEIVSVVEQVFEHGRMVWFRDTRTIAVLIGDEVDPTQGEWLCFPDIFVEGSVEFLPTLQPPADVTTASTWPDARIQQPIRGFGQVWRENDNVRFGLGWALTPEYEHSSAIEYVAGGTFGQW